MTNELSKEGIKYLVSILVENAKEAAEDMRKDPDNIFESGRSLAYYEVISTLKNTLPMDEEELKEIGLDFDIEKAFL